MGHTEANPAIARMTYTAFEAWWWPYVFVLVAGVLATEVWRVLGVLAARTLTEGAEILNWVRAVATALIAGVIAQLVLYPVGALSAIPLAWRLVAVAAGCLVYVATRGRVLWGIVGAEVVLLAANAFF